ncbi:MAG TPA: serine protease, partial [Labilithrix sp.]
MAAIVGCGGGKPPAAPAVAEKASPPPAEVHEQIVPHTCAARTKLAQLLGEASKTPAPHAAAVSDTPDSAPAPAAAPPTPGAKASANQVYRTVAPTTVLLRGEHGMGTGVVVDPKGFVLTNYHVAADGRKKDFVYTIDVNFGDLTPTGRMVKQDKTYEASVVKVDQVRDLALLKIK